MFIELELVETFLRERNRNGFALAEKVMNGSLVYKHFAPSGALAAGRSPNFDWVLSRRTVTLRTSGSKPYSNRLR
jgi:hypothetical protein